MNQLKCLVIMVFVLGVFLPVSGFSNQLSVKITPLGDPPDSVHKKIPPPDQKQLDQVQGAFKNFGLVDRVGRKEVVINDTLRLLSLSSRIYSSSGATLSSSSLRKGQSVEFEYNRKNVITRLKIIE